MDFFQDPEIIKLTALGSAFVIGVSVCFYVAARETIELNRRRRAKKLIYKDAVSREIKRKKNNTNQTKIDVQESERRSFA